MRTPLRLLVCLCAASLSVAVAQEAKTTKTTHRTQSHHARSTHHASHAASKPTKKTEAYANQGPVAPSAAEPEAIAGAAPVVEPVVVTYERGALAIAAHDAPLRQVLDKVREATGAIVEAPDFEQRVSVTVAADAPLQAIAALLDGMHLDYAMLGGTTVDDPVQKIIIAPRNATSPGRLASAAGSDSVPTRTLGALSPPQPAADERAWENAPARPARDH
jgi:hypothetical protein